MLAAVFQALTGQNFPLTCSDKQPERSPTARPPRIPSFSVSRLNYRCQPGRITLGPNSWNTLSPHIRPHCNVRETKPTGIKMSLHFGSKAIEKGFGVSVTVTSIKGSPLNIFLTDPLCSPHGKFLLIPVSQMCTCSPSHLMLPRLVLLKWSWEGGEWTWCWLW